MQVMQCIWLKDVINDSYKMCKFLHILYESRKNKLSYTVVSFWSFSYIVS